jgi:hypothetical protein
MNNAMEKHIYFWLGVLSAILLAVPASIGTMFVLGTEAINLAAFAVGALFSLVSCLLATLAFRDRILQKLFGTANTSMITTANSFGNIIFSAASRDLEKTRHHSEEFSKNILSWYAWSSFYKWIIGTGVALLGTFAVFAGTILIVDQNNQLRKGNEQSLAYSRTSQTMDMIALASNNVELKKDIEAIGKEIRTKLNEPIPTDSIKISTRNVLNHYESISTAANQGVLNKEILLEAHGGGMIRLLNYAQSEYLKESRCSSHQKFSRKRFEQFEIFVECEVKKRYDIPVIHQDETICGEMIKEKLKSSDYCK